MSGNDGVYWHCTDRSCNWSFVATDRGTNEGAEPQCVCGKAMVRGKVVPIFHYLDFLREGAGTAPLDFEKE